MTIQQQTVDYEGEELESTEKETVSKNNHWKAFFILSTVNQNFW